MSSKEQQKLEQEKWRAAQIYALNFDIEPRFDYGWADASPPQRAFQLLSCGMDMLPVLLASAFPSLDKRVAKKGAKWAREALMWNGPHAGGLLARVVPNLLAEMGGHLGDGTEDDIEAVEEPELHLSLKKCVEDFFPRLRSNKAAVYDLETLLEPCGEEFEVLYTGKAREDVAAGRQPGTEYSAALLRSENPSSDPALVHAQRLYARDYFIHKGTLGAMYASMFSPDAGKMTSLIVSLDPNDPKHADYRARALAAWFEASRPYREYALLAYRESGLAEKHQSAPAGTRS